MTPIALHKNRKVAASVLQVGVSTLMMTVMTESSKVCRLAARGPASGLRGDCSASDAGLRNHLIAIVTATRSLNAGRR